MRTTAPILPLKGNANAKCLRGQTQRVETIDQSLNKNANKLQNAKDFIPHTMFHQPST